MELALNALVSLARILSLEFRVLDMLMLDNFVGNSTSVDEVTVSFNI